MKLQKRILFAIGILLLDMVVVFLPLSAIFLAYIILFNPPWARRFFEDIK